MKNPPKALNLTDLERILLRQLHRLEHEILPGVFSGLRSFVRETASEIRLASIGDEGQEDDHPMGKNPYSGLGLRHDGLDPADFDDEDDD